MRLCTLNIYMHTNDTLYCICRVVVSSTGGDGMLSVSQETVKQFPAKEVKVGPRQAKVFTFQPTF